MIRFALAFLMMVSPVAGQEYIVTDGRLSDVDFHRLVACAARSGQSCEGPMVRWTKSRVSVTFAPIPVGYPADLSRELDRALETAVAQINAAARGVNLRRVSKSQPADIKLFLKPIHVGDAIRPTGFSEMDSVPIGAAQVQIYWDESRSLTQAAIVFASDIPLDQAGPILLEELTQSMGLMTDIRNPYYETRSVFSEDSNSVAKLGVQDRAALRLHYPAP